MDNEQPTPWVVESTEQITEGLSLEWYKDRQIVVYRVTSASHETLTAWTNTVVNLLENWQEGRMYLAIHDLSTRGISLSYAVKVKHHVQNLGVTPTGRDRVDEIFAKRPKLFARVALVFSPTFSGNLGQTFARISRAEQLNVDYKVCFELEPAFQWLAEFLK